MQESLHDPSPSALKERIGVQSPRLFPRNEPLGEILEGLSYSDDEGYGSKVVLDRGHSLPHRPGEFLRTVLSFARFRATHHVTSDHVIDITADTAQLRANLTAMHLWADDECDPNLLETHFVAGGVLLALAIRTSDGWRISELVNRNTWRSGAGMSAMANYERPVR
jgi:hypothetical protein